MGEVTEKIYCCDRGDNDNALAAAILAGNNRRDDWGPMAAMMGGGMNNWMNNPFAYLMFMALLRNGGFGFGGDGAGAATQGIETQAQLNAIRTQLQDNQNADCIKSAIQGNGFALMSAKGYSEYVKKHGYHFTDALAEHVSKMMENANGQQHTWTTSQVKKSMESLGLTIPSHVTHGDAAYLANMYYADLYPDPLKDEASCLRAAYKVANDPDGYEGMIFCRWTADAIGKAIKLDWEKFV